MPCACDSAECYGAPAGSHALLMHEGLAGEGRLPSCGARPVQWRRGAWLDHGLHVCWCQAACCSLVHKACACSPPLDAGCTASLALWGAGDGACSAGYIITLIWQPQGTEVLVVETGLGTHLSSPCSGHSPLQWCCPISSGAPDQLLLLLLLPELKSCMSHGALHALAGPTRLELPVRMVSCGYHAGP